MTLYMYNIYSTYYTVRMLYGRTFHEQTNLFSRARGE